MRLYLRLMLSVLLAVTPVFALEKETPVTADVLLRGGTLHRGDGEAALTGDVAIEDGRIVAVGSFDVGAVGKEIDCRGLVISPGFIDLHNHSDYQVVKKSTRAVVNFLTQGCTTIVTGNCGAGPVDVGKYYDEIDARGAGVNVAHLLPQGNLRSTVVGDDEREATADELTRMSELTERAMQDGAWGMSTGLIYVPSSYADTDELVSLAEVVAAHEGIYASHIRNEGSRLLEAVDEAIEIGRRARLPVHVSHFKSTGKDAWGLVRKAARNIVAQRRSGMTITADQYPYTASSTSLGAIVVPAWARAGGHAELLARLDDAEDGSRIRDAISRKLVQTDGGQRLQIAGFAKRPQWAGRRLSEVALDEKIEPLELVLKILRAGGASMVNHSINESDVRHVMQLSWVATASDGRAYLPGATVPHPRNYGTFPRKLSHYAMQEKVVSLAHAIRSSTGLPADILGMEDRGYLRPGHWADVVVWDPETLVDRATFEDPHNYSRGVVHVFVNGEQAIARGTPTGALGGRALRHRDQDETPEALAAGLDRVFAEWDRPDSPGCALGVLREGELIHWRGYGSANLDWELPLDEESLFYIASVSKQFVVACVMLLAIDGALSLDDEVQKHVPKLPQYEAPITIRHLIHHTSGLRDYFLLLTLAGWRPSNVIENRDLLELVCRQKELDFPTGDKHQYSNTGYLLMAQIVERVSGKSLRTFADERIFSPLGMDSTRFHDARHEIVRNRVTSYVRDGEAFRVSYLANWDKVGSGGLLSSVEDLARWDRNFYTKEVGGDELQRLLHTRGVLNDGTAIGYAGGIVHGEYKGLRTVGHSGSFMGFRTLHLRFPDERFSVILLSNLGDVDPRALASQVADLYLAESIAKAIGVYTGRYQSEELGVSLSVEVDGVDLRMTQGGKTLRLESTGPGAFSAGGRALVFERDDEGRVNALRLGSGRAPGVRFERIGVAPGDR